MSTTYRDAVAKHGSYRNAAKAMGIARTTFFDRWKKETATEVFKKKSAFGPVEMKGPGVDAWNATLGGPKVQRYIFTCAVRNAPAHEDFLNNLIAYAVHLGAQLVVGPLTSTTRQRFADLDEMEFDELLHPYISDDPLVVGDRIRFSPELNLTPTCVKPLEGLQTYTKRLWGVFPHTKVSLESVPTHKDRPSKINVSTGAITAPHYSPTKAGFRAKFDHVYGAVIVEVTENGQWIRHLTPKDDTDGTFYDLDKHVYQGIVISGRPVEAIIYGDIHVEKLNAACAKATWKLGSHDYAKHTSLVELLKPRVQVFHDLMDMTAINYHEMGDFFKRYEKYIKCEEQAIVGFNMAGQFLDQVQRLAPKNIVVDSNHDHFLYKWLLKFDPAQTGDFTNAEIFFTLKLDALKQLAHGHPFSMMERAIRLLTGRDSLCDTIQFLGPDQSYEIMGVELGWHGHRGAHGSRGSKGSFKFVTEKSTTAHIHQAHIASGSHIVGTSSELDLGYNQGPSAWSHTHGVLYPHGHRALLTMSDDKFWADQGSVE